MIRSPPPSGKRGRRQACSAAVLQVCLTLKVQFGLPLRQVTGFVESLLGLAGLDRAVPDCSTLCRRQKTLTVDIPYRGCHGPLRLPRGSTGIKAEGEGEWRSPGKRPPGSFSGPAHTRKHARKHGGSKWRIRRKAHIAVDEGTPEVRAAEGERASATGSREPVNGSHIGDAPMLPELLNQIPPDQEVGSVTGDGAYDTRKCHDAIADRGAEAIIPPRKNARPWKPTTAGARARNETLRAVKCLGAAIWRRWSGYHRRSRVEAKMHCVNRRTAQRNVWVRASWRGTSTGRSRRFKSVAPS